MAPILTAKVGTNADLFPDVLSLYCPENGLVLDATWGKGVFWRNLPNARVVGMDLAPRMGAKLCADVRSLPFADAMFDATVFDPPYARHGKTPIGIKGIVDNFGLDTVPDYNCVDIVNLYRDGLKELRRVLKPGRCAIVKTQDEIESGKQKWKHAELLNVDGFLAEDLFILVQKCSPVMRHPYQHHARKNHSYFIVLRKL